MLSTCISQNILTNGWISLQDHFTNVYPIFIESIIVSVQVEIPAHVVTCTGVCSTRSIRYSTSQVIAVRSLVIDGGRVC